MAAVLDVSIPTGTVWSHAARSGRFPVCATSVFRDGRSMYSSMEHAPGEGDCATTGEKRPPGLTTESLNCGPRD